MFKEIIPYEYTIDFNNPKQGYLEEFNADFYEFPVIITDALLSKTLEDSKNDVTYKVIAVKKKKPLNFLQYKFLVKM